MHKQVCQGLMAFTLCIFTNILFPSILQAQVTPISGVVQDNKGQAIPGANIYIKDSYDGASSDTSGKFSFDCYETGKQLLVVSFIGYEDFSDSIELTGAPIEINPVLKEEFNELNAVVISAGAFEASDEGKAVVFKPLDIVTTAGANGDIFGALGTLPGAQQVGNEDGLFVRGGAGYETSTIIDGMVVQNPFFSSVPDVPNRGRFSPFLFDGTVFSTGGYSAQYGQALSSAIVLKTTDMPPQDASGLSLSPIFAGGFTTRIFNKERSAISASVNYLNTYLYNEIVPQIIDFPKPVQGYGGSLNFNHKTSQTGIFKLYTTYNLNELAINYPGANDTLPGIGFELENQNVYVNSTWKEILGEKWTILAGFSYSYNSDDIATQVLLDPLPIDSLGNPIPADSFRFAVDQADERMQGKLTLTNQLTDKIKIRFGGELHGYSFTNPSTRDGSSFGETSIEKLSDIYSAAFAESEFYITNDLAGRIGFRSEYSEQLDEFNIAPRLSLAYKMGKNSQVSLAYGHFYQTPLAPFLVQAAEDLTYERADHYIANYQVMAEKRTFRIEAYYKDYKNLVLWDSTTNLFGSEGDGYAGGLEFFYRDQKTIRNGDFWISYSLIETQRRFRDYPEQARPNFASQHLTSVVYKHYITKINTQFGVTYSFQSGRPFHDPSSDAFLSARTKDFHQVSVNASYLTSIKGNFTVIFASVGNILGRDNIFGYRQSFLDGTPIVGYPTNLTPDVDYIENALRPPAKRTFFAGMFISFQHKPKLKKFSTPSQGDSDSPPPAETDN